LNEACREAFNSILEKLESQEHKISSLKTDLRIVTAQLGTVVGLLQGSNGDRRSLHTVDAGPQQHVENDGVHGK
jgi:hypothetical protein